jgi:hypothetical protein
MGRAAKLTAKPTPLPPPPTRRPAPGGNVPTGARALGPGERTYDPAPARPRPFK